MRENLRLRTVFLHDQNSKQKYEVKSILFFMSFLIPASAFAGACLNVDEIAIYDMEIYSCARMSDEIAGEVSSNIASPKRVAKLYPGIIVGGNVESVRIVRAIHKNPLAGPWTDMKKRKFFILVS